MPDPYIHRSCLTVFMGIPGSGKSTVIREWARDVDGIVVCPDMIRGRMHGDGSYDPKLNDTVFKIAHMEVRDALKENDNHVFFDATGVTRRDAILRVADQAKDWLVEMRKATNGGELHPYDEIVVERDLAVMMTPHEVSVARNAERAEDAAHGSKRVPDAAMWKMIANFEKSLAQIAFEGWDTIHFLRGDA